MTESKVTAAGQPASIKETIYFAKNRMRQLPEEITAKKEEFAVWMKVLEEIKPCDECEGDGSFRVFIAQDESEMQQCRKCQGKGILR